MEGIMKTNTTITTTIYFVRNPDGSINTFATSQDVETFFLRLVLNGESTDGYTLYTAAETPINVTRPSVTLGSQKSGRSGPKNRGPNGLPMTKDGREYRPGRRKAEAEPTPSTTTEELVTTLPVAPAEPEVAPTLPRFVADDVPPADAIPSAPPAPTTPRNRTHRRAVVA
jgi:hypothetical protein